jgi:hypothetical protein
MLGFKWMRWLGVFITSQPLQVVGWILLAMGAPDSPVCHRTVTVYWPVRATSAQPLGFGAVDRWRRLSSSCTGQSDGLWLLRFWLCRGTVAHCCFCRVGRWRREPLLCWLIGQSGGTPDSPVNYSEGCPGILESGWFGVLRAWCTGHCPVVHRTVRCAIFQHTQVLLLQSDCVP